MSVCVFNCLFVLCVCGGDLSSRREKVLQGVCYLSLMCYISPLSFPPFSISKDLSMDGPKPPPTKRPAPTINTKANPLSHTKRSSFIHSPSSPSPSTPQVRKGRPPKNPNAQQQQQQQYHHHHRVPEKEKRRRRRDDETIFADEVSSDDESELRL